MPEARIEALGPSETTRDALAEILVEVVAGDGSVGFLHPLGPAEARAFWEGALASADRGERVVLGASVGDALSATVTLILATPPNQSHRADVVKLMTRPSARGLGLARALMLAVESVAVSRGRTLLVLDTAAVGGAAGLYDGLGYTRLGLIPDYALTPLGTLTGTWIYWKRIGAGSEVELP